MATKKQKFLKQFLKDRQMVGAVRPSTRFLAKKMLENIDFKKDKLIVELGPGTGVFTEKILERMPEDGQLFIFEVNDHFHQLLTNRINDPRVKIIHDSAEFIDRYLEKGAKADIVLSSLPLMVFSDELRKSVVNASYDILKKKGKYIQFQYSLQSKKLLESHYESVDIKFTLINVPPAFVYTCLKN